MNRVNEEAVEASRDMPSSELLRLSETVRAETLALLARIEDDQFDEQMPGVPWSGGTIGAVLLHSSGDRAPLEVALGRPRGQRRLTGEERARWRR